MGWFQRIFQGETKSFDVDQWSALIDTGARTAADIYVSPVKAMRHAPVQLGVGIRTGTMATLGAHVYNRADKTRAEDHPLYRLLHDRPNGWTSSTSFVQEMEKDCVLEGRAYALANRAGSGKIMEIIKLDFHSVTPDCDQNQEPIYKVALKGGGTVTYSWRDILDVPTLGNLSAIRQCREAIGLAMAMERHAAKLMANGARPSGVYKNKKKLSDIAYERLKRSVNSNFSGESAGGVVLLEEDSDFTPLTFSSVDIQFQEMRAFQLVEIARTLGVPPNLLFDFSRATWANAETASQAYLTFTLMPRAKLWEGALMRLLSEEDQAAYYIEFDANGLVRADIAARFEAYAKAVAARIMNPNEARARENLAPYKGGDEFSNPNIEAGKPPLPGERPKPTLVAAS
ncbi:phage portal protein [Bradyrhizobium sp. MOS002]|uniref:phage portal protein n=1 Tax=Bradyrhizobium sp. MOS002 TaxID=2133947 RepID=UPI000D129CA9|nr:phage portal protein [Bradyrhizobium sp. MOS002]PSO30216.1 phage portal protein [Bradyrhizobium sp. MOS002]